MDAAGDVVINVTTQMLELIGSVISVEWKLQKNLIMLSQEYMQAVIFLKDKSVAKIITGNINMRVQLVDG